MMRRTKKLLILCCLWPGLGFSQATYNLPQLEALTLESSRALFATRDQVQAARFAVDAAGALPNPEIEYLRGTSRARSPAGNPGDVSSVSLSQPIDLPWRRQARIGTAVADLAVTEAGSKSFEADTLARVRLRYFEILRRDAELKNAIEDKTLMESVRGRIALRVETGEAPRFELIKADAEALNAAKSAQAAAFRLEQARSMLRQAVGHSLPASFTVSGHLRDVPALSPLNSLRQEVSSSSPDLARARAEMVRAERQLELERAQRWPQLAIKASVDSDVDVRSSKVGLVMTVPLWDRRSAQVSEAASRLAKARNELEAHSFSLEQQLQVAYQQYEIAETQVIALESAIVRQAEAALRVAEAAYRFGERGFLEVLDAQRVYRAARSELIAARHELATSWVEIERLRAAPGGK